jgi:hypothetical protein
MAGDGSLEALEIIVSCILLMEKHGQLLLLEMG